MTVDTLTTGSLLSSHSPAIIVPTRPSRTVITHVQLIKLVSDFSQKLGTLGVRSHDTVAIALPNSLEFVVSFLATTSRRAIAAPLNSAYKQDEFSFYFDDLRPSVLIVPQGSLVQNTPAVQAAHICRVPVAEITFDLGAIAVTDFIGMGKAIEEAPLEQPCGEDIAMFLHTSGTTGRPKIVPLTHRNMTSSCRNIQATYDLGAFDRGLLVMPLFHVHGLMAGLLAPIVSGGSVIIPARFSAKDFWADFTNNYANWYTAVPTIHQIILNNPLPEPVPKIRFVRSCSSPFSPNLLQDLEDKLGAPVLEAYAMTEAAHQMTSNPLPPAVHKAGSVGLPQSIELKIMDSDGMEVPVGTKGEICIRGENVTSGYHNNPEANKTAFFDGGFFRTGDQGMKDEDGYVKITGRLKELINKGGEKVSPIDLDNLYVQHPAVAEAVSFAIDDHLYGQEIAVAVVLKEGASLHTQAFKTWVGERAVKFKVPKEVFVVEVMPKTATGKVQRRIVAQTVLAQVAPVQSSTTTTTELKTSSLSPNGSKTTRRLSVSQTTLLSPTGNSPSTRRMSVAETTLVSPAGEETSATVTTTTDSDAWSRNNSIAITLTPSEIESLEEQIGDMQEELFGQVDYEKPKRHVVFSDKIEYVDPKQQVVSWDNSIIPRRSIAGVMAYLSAVFGGLPLVRF